ncbi:hypothetical protein [Chitiniphilus shinanonensis]|uniref:hypothetical protein n=1 Tax=Chitiniphilus shinanonensis TaxID=553088 RepID=UPI00304ACBA5
MNDGKGKNGWRTDIFSDPTFEHLVAELYFDGSLVLVLDRDEGRDAVSVSFPDASKEGGLGARVRLTDFKQALEAAVENLTR